jgi:hypothetical protein
MKPLHIGLLIAAGAIGGAVVMKVTQRPQPAPPVMTAQVQPPATAPAPTPAPAAEAPLPEPPKPAAQEPEAAPARKPTKVPRPAPRPLHSTPVIEEPRSTPATKPDVPIAASPTAQPTISPAPEPVAPAPAPQPVPPAQPEPEHVTPPPPPPPEPSKVTLNAGTLIPVRLVDGLTTERNTPGDLFTATLDKELVVDGFVIAERGARVEGRVVSSDPGGRVNGVATLGVVLNRLCLSDGQWIAINTDPFERHAEASRRDDAAKIGAGAAIGAVIGAIAGGGKGAAIGAGAGGAAGTGAVLATRGKPAALPSETRLSFRINSPVTVVERR